MSDKVIFDSAGLDNLKADLTRAAAEIATVAHGAYVAGDMFPQSAGDAADAMTRLRDSLLQSANRMNDILMSTAAYFQQVIEGFEQWDLEQEVKAYDLHPEIRAGYSTTHIDQSPYPSTESSRYA